MTSAETLLEPDQIVTHEGTNPGHITRDKLEYMADLISELNELTDRAGFVTLAAILQSAHVEARLQIVQFAAVVR